MPLVFWYFQEPTENLLGKPHYVDRFSGFMLDSQALQVIGYYDEVELCNPIGSYVQIHKLGSYLSLKTGCHLLPLKTSTSAVLTLTQTSTSNLINILLAKM